MSDLITDLYGESSSPHLKAADNEGMNRTCTIKSADREEVTFPNGDEKKGIVIDIGASKPIFLSRTNAVALADKFGGDLSAWEGKRIILQTKGYDINGNKTVGWITLPMPEDAPDDDIPF